MITIRLNFRALLRPLCWLFGHGWKDYLVVHPGWNREGRYCTRCRREHFVLYAIAFGDHGETIHTRTDWNGTESYTYVQVGTGNAADPIRMKKVPVERPQRNA